MDFRSRRQAEFHTGDSPFESINIDMIECLPSDYMHMLCPGITERMLQLWRRFGAPRRALF